jgi:protein required for attachment to host cells
MQTRWIVAADSSKARIFKAMPGKPLVELETLTHPESRLADRDMASDRPGLTMERGGERRHGMEPSSDPKRQEAVNFARQVAGNLDKARSLQKFQELIIVAAPAFLGMLREQLSRQVEQTITREISKNISALSPSEIQAHLRDDS